MAKTVKAKKVDYKGRAKAMVKEKLKELFKDYEIHDFAMNPVEGFTKDTIIVKNLVVEGSDDTYDVQIKLITPAKKGDNENTHYVFEAE